ncbi:hypothetical protein ZWY2020_059485 [Hordeum vulgare]|nr:hypothetical protein ZWY2020_059485 [Hordeum vulgare]
MRVLQRYPRLSLVARVSAGVAPATQDAILAEASGRHGREGISPLPRSHGDAAGFEGGARSIHWSAKQTCRRVMMIFPKKYIDPDVAKHIP